MLFGWWQRARRNRLLAEPFPEPWLGHFDALYFYPLLTPEEQHKLRNDVRIFCAEKDWEGCRGAEINDEVKVTIAAQACLLTLKLSGDPYRLVQSILVYPTEYLVPTRENLGGVELEGEAPMLGQAHYRGPVLLAWNEVQEGARDPYSGCNLVFHEFAHQLDMLDGEANGAPPLSRMLAARWQKVMRREYRRLLAAASRREPTLLDPYGAQDEAEFFAVATECFFTRPGAMRQEHPELYEVLREYYLQDPAARLA